MSAQGPPTSDQGKLERSLALLDALRDQGIVAVRSRDLSRTHRERLVRTGHLSEVMKGWYIATRPAGGTATHGLTRGAWHDAFWGFCAGYLAHRFGPDWCLAPEHSLAIHLGDWTVPPLLIVRAGRGGNKPTALPFGGAILDLRQAPPEPAEVEQRGGVRVMCLAAALVASPPAAYEERPRDLRAALAMVDDVDEFTTRLVAGNHGRAAGRLAGALRHLGRDAQADRILAAMKTAGHRVSEEDRFPAPTPPMLARRGRSPYANRHELRRLWRELREDLPSGSLPAAAPTADATQTLEDAASRYREDASNSLALDGYAVSEAVDRTAGSGRHMPPDDGPPDPELLVHEPARIALGYRNSFRAALDSLQDMLHGQPAGAVLARDLPRWYKVFTAPRRLAGISLADDLGGYRNHSVYRRGSVHTPPRHEALRDLLPVFFKLVQDEPDGTARALMGHLVCGYLQPFSEGSGALGRLLMNVLLRAGGHSWMVIPASRGDDYAAAAEAAWVDGRSAPFATLIAELAAQAPAPGRHS